MLEPRSLATAIDNWLTDSRVYNLIWLGRWLERGEGISRWVNSAARSVSVNESGAANGQLAEALIPVANTLGVPVENRETLPAELILDSQIASIHYCLSKARLNASHVAPVELIQAISAAILDLEEADRESLNSPEGTVSVTDGVANRVATIYSVVEDRWFGSESLTEEEVFHRFVQQ